MGALVVAMAVVVGGIERVDELCIIRSKFFYSSQQYVGEGVQVVGAYLKHS